MRRLLTIFIVGLPSTLLAQSASDEKISRLITVVERMDLRIEKVEHDLRALKSPERAAAQAPSRIQSPTTEEHRSRLEALENQLQQMRTDYDRALADLRESLQEEKTRQSISEQERRLVAQFAEIESRLQSLELGIDQRSGTLRPQLDRGRTSVDHRNDQARNGQILDDDAGRRRAEFAPANPEGAIELDPFESPESPIYSDGPDQRGDRETIDAALEAKIDAIYRRDLEFNENVERLGLPSHGVAIAPRDLDPFDFPEPGAPRDLDPFDFPEPAAPRDLDPFDFPEPAAPRDLDPFDFPEPAAPRDLDPFDFPEPAAPRDLDPPESAKSQERADRAGSVPSERSTTAKSQLQRDSLDVARRDSGGVWGKGEEAKLYAEWMESHRRQAHRSPKVSGFSAAIGGFRVYTRSGPVYELPAVLSESASETSRLLDIRDRLYRYAVDQIDRYRTLTR